MLEFKMLSTILNAYRMVIKNIRAYMLLSVSIILSFSLLLTYLIYADSKVYNDYKKALGASPYIFIVYGDGDSLETENKMAVLESKITELKNTYNYQYFEQQVYYNGIHYKVEFVPNNAFAYFLNWDERINMKNSESIKIVKNKAIINEELYNLIKGNTNDKGKLYVDVPVEFEGGINKLIRLEVSDICENSQGDQLVSNEQGEIIGTTTVLVSLETFDEYSIGSAANRHMLIYSEDIAETMGWLENMDMTYDSACLLLEDAMKDIQMQINTKRTFAIIMLMLLGINLYGSFTNALEKRKFEIGVRRAVGASKLDIVKQFFVEGMFIMLVNIFIAVALVIFGFSIYKIVMHCVYGVEWILMTNIYSILIFLFSCVFMSLFFSMIFGIRSTNVEIVKYLKTE